MSRPAVVLRSIGAMTTNRMASRPVAVPAFLLGGAAVFFLTNDTTSSEAARSAAGTVADWPTWAQHAVAGASEGGLVLLALLLAASAWRARSRGPHRVATAVVGGLGVVLALGISELMKVLVAQDRPCRTVPGLDAVAHCPPIGDWSLPSNHATLAAALAAALIWSSPRRWPLAMLLALLVASARVGLGVHYPHDVVDGLVLGAAVASASVVLLRRPATRLVAAASGVPVLRPVLTAEERRTQSHVSVGRPDPRTKDSSVEERARHDDVPPRSQKGMLELQAGNPALRLAVEVSTGTGN